MLTRTRKRSSRITLVLMGAAALAACSDSTPEHRDLYASKQDCVQDWGEETKCEPAPASATSGTTHRHSGSGFFWGPIYRGAPTRIGSGTSSSIGSTGARSSSRAIGSTSVSRGGFGSSASSHSSGG